MITVRDFIPYPFISFLIGVFLASVMTLSQSLSLLFLFVSALLFVLASVLRRSTIFFGGCIILALALGMLRYLDWQNAPLSQAMDDVRGESAVLYGVVSDEPDVREGSTHLTLRVLRVDDVVLEDVPPVHAIVFAARYPEYQYGDVLTVEGNIASPKQFRDGDAPAFNYPMYLASKEISYQVFFPRIALLEHGKGNPVIARLYGMKYSFQEQLARLLPEPHSALLGGLLLGGKQSLGAAWQETFRAAGIIHVVVLSGYNMTIVSEWLVIFFRFLGFYGSLSMGALGITLFALMTGAGATVLRAAVMAIIALCARATGRTYVMARALLIAGVCMVLHNPSILVFDPSFQLSFLASLGLIVVAPSVSRHTTLFAGHSTLREVFVSTVATQLMVLPLLLYQTGLFSIVSLPVNMLVLPLIPATMLFGFCAGVAGFIAVPFGQMIALPAHALLSWVLFVAKIGAAIPFAVAQVHIGVTLLFLSYLLLLLWLWFDDTQAQHQPLVNGASDKKEKAQYPQ